MALHGIHVGRTTDSGQVIQYNKGRYTARCNCGVYLHPLNARQAAQSTLACPECWSERQSANGKLAKGWPARKQDNPTA